MDPIMDTVGKVGQEQGEWCDEESVEGMNHHVIYRMLKVTVWCSLAVITLLTLATGPSSSCGYSVACNHASHTAQVCVTALPACADDVWGDPVQPAADGEADAATLRVL
jgi:hypothetical protein